MVMREATLTEKEKALEQAALEADGYDFVDTSSGSDDGHDL